MVKVILAKGTVVNMSERTALKAVEDALRESGSSKIDAHKVSREVEVDLLKDGRAFVSSLNVFMVAV